MTEDDIMPPSGRAVPETDKRSVDIAHDHALYRLIDHAASLVSQIDNRSKFIEEGVDRFDVLVDEANRQDSSLALVSHDISAKWRSERDDEAFSEDLQFLIKQSATRYRNPLEYEGIDTSEHDVQWRRSMDGVGEKVRFDPEQKVSGIDTAESQKILGDRELTISKAVVRGEERSNGLGDSYAASILEYEFEGISGRHNAQQFVEAEGREHVLGMIMAKDDRLWIVPIQESNSHDPFEDPRVDGEARELIDYAGKHQRDHHPDGIEGLKKELVQDGALFGEYDYRPKNGHDASGPVELYSLSWASAAGEKQITVASAAIDAAIAAEAPERVHSKGLPEQAPSMPSRGMER